MKPTTCELHPGAACYLGGAEGRTWICPACEHEREKHKAYVYDHRVGRPLVNAHQRNADTIAELQVKVASLESDLQMQMERCQYCYAADIVATHNADTIADLAAALRDCLGYVESDYETRRGGYGGAQATVDRARAALAKAEGTK